MTQSRRVAVIHVGLEKTGTTAVQAWLAARRADLWREGVLFPASPGAQNHTRLVAACLDDAVIDNIKAHQMAAQARSAPALRARFLRDFGAELGQGGWSRLVLSSELISSRLFAASEVDRLIAMVAPHVDALRIVLVLRRQADLALSRFSSVLRAGFDRYAAVWDDLSAVAFRALPAGRVVDDMGDYFDFDRILSRFARLDAELRVSLYDPTDPLGPVLSALDLPPVPDALPRVNSALSAPAQALIARLNRDHAVQFPSGLRNEAYQTLLRQIEAQVSGPPRQVPRAEAEAFQARFTASNDRLAARTGLRFSHDFSAFPPRVDDHRQPEPEALRHWQAKARALPRSEPSGQLALRRLRRLAADLGLR